MALLNRRAPGFVGSALLTAGFVAGGGETEGPHTLSVESSSVTETAYETVPAVEPAEPPASAGTVVMKFGGTSVADPDKIRNVARRLVAAKGRGGRVVGVVSAMGQHTDELLALAHEVSEAPKPRELDMLVSVGERISCALVAMAISDLGHDAISLTGSQAGIVTDTAHGKAKIVDVRAKRIHEALDQDRIVLVAGFQGVSTDLDITTLGRGGTDLTAAALASALGADACEIYTDVEGVFTADPRVVPSARKLHAVSYEEMLEMAASGAKVLQLRSVEFARNHRVRLHVRSTFGEADGTWVREEDERMLEKAIISGVTHTVEEAVYEVRETGPADLFEALAGAGVNVDTIIQIGPEIVFSVPHEDRREAEEALARLDAPWTEHGDLAKVSVVGAGMRSHPGIAARAFGVLRDLGVTPRFVSTSPIKIAFFVTGEEVERVVAALHEAFELADATAERAHG
jgi:aspartate kinase